MITGPHGNARQVHLEVSHTDYSAENVQLTEVKMVKIYEKVSKDNSLQNYTPALQQMLLGFRSAESGAAVSLAHMET